MLSVAIICRDSAATIARTLDSVAPIATEVVALDSGSIDDTIAILESHHARVIRTEWKGFVATKQLALDSCTQPWILSLDSDESLEPDLAASIKRALETNDPAIDAYRVNRKVFYAGRFLEHAWQPEHRIRLVRAGSARWGGLDPHDKLEPTDTAKPVPLLPGTLRHDSITTFADFLAKQARHAATMARSMQREGARPSYLRLVTSPPGAFLKQLILKSAWRDGWRGWLAAASTGVATAMKHITLIEITRNPPK
jgi:glycosyltransferase involved in cell wall biosynthesis